MKIVLVAIATAAVMSGTNAFAGPTCGNAPQGNQPVAQTLRTLVDAGFKFQRVKVTNGGCYEFKGTNTLGDKVEIYLNPSDGTNVKTETKRV